MNVKGKLSSGCVFLPTFRDTHLLLENFAGRAEVAAAIEIHVFDDNFDAEESRAVKNLCVENQWHYHKPTRQRHGDILEDYSDLSEWNRLCLSAMHQLSSTSDYVVKVDTDACLIDPFWFEELEHLLPGRLACAGTFEYRPLEHAAGFWELAQKQGFPAPAGTHAMHIQGGIAAYSKLAVQQLWKIGIWPGKHRFSEDFYFSYLAQFLGIECFSTKTIGSWWHPYRPSLESIRNLRAIHPLTLSEWHNFNQSNPCNQT